LAEEAAVGEVEEGDAAAEGEVDEEGVEVDEEVEVVAVGVGAEDEEAGDEEGEEVDVEGEVGLDTAPGGGAMEADGQEHGLDLARGDGGQDGGTTLSIITTSPSRS
jgi:hypothetical protein